MDIKVKLWAMSDAFAGQGRHQIQRLVDYANGSTRGRMRYWCRVRQGRAMRPQVRKSSLHILILNASVWEACLLQTRSGPLSSRGRTRLLLYGQRSLLLLHLTLQWVSFNLIFNS